LFFAATFQASTPDLHSIAITNALRTVIHFRYIVGPHDWQGCTGQLRDNPGRVVFQDVRMIPNGDHQHPWKPDEAKLKDGFPACVA